VKRDGAFQIAAFRDCQGLRNEKESEKDHGLSAITPIPSLIM
jgi:hypothetical protein